MAALAALYALVPLYWAVVLVAVLVWLRCPACFRQAPLRAAARIADGRSLAGPAGLRISSLGLLALWAAGTRNLALLMLAPILGGVAALPARRLAGTLTLPRFALTPARVPCFSSP